MSIHLMSRSGWNVGDDFEFPTRTILGEGSYSTVEQAQMISRGRETVAIKKMEGIFSNYPDSVKAYREMHILRRLSHPNVIEMYVHNIMYCIMYISIILCIYIYCILYIRIIYYIVYMYYIIYVLYSLKGIKQFMMETELLW